MTHPRRGWTAWYPPIFALVLLLILLWVTRGDFLTSHAAFNPDEAELIAEARRASLDLIPYSTYTGTTHLFLWPMLLALLGKLGVPLTLATAHVLAGLSYVWIAFAGWYVIARSAGWIVAGIFVLPTSLYLLTAKNDFLSLGTELLPLSIVMLAAITALAPEGRHSRGRLVIVGTLTGLSVWAKPQIAPLALAVLLVAILHRNLLVAHAVARCKTSPSIWHDTLAGIVGLVLPSVVFLTIMLFAGTLHSFFEEPVRFQLSYVFSRAATGGSAPSLAGRLQEDATFILQYPMAFPWAIAGLVGWSQIALGHRRSSRWMAMAAWLAPLVAAFFGLLLAFPIFPHYANNLYSACLISGMTGATFVRHFSSDRRSFWRPVSPSLLLFVPIALLSVIVWSTSIPPPAASNPRPSITPLTQACPARSRVLVWGWAAELYSYYDWTPASRYVDSVWQILPTEGRPYYQRTLLSELSGDPPTCIVEALGSQFFGDYTHADAITTVLPSATSLVDRCYMERRMPLQDGREVTVFRRTTRCSAHPTGSM